MQTSYTRGMRPALFWRTVSLSAVLSLGACGGGGDNAGECFGGEQVCGGLAPSTPTILPSAPDLRSLTCDDMLAKADGSRPAAYELAQQYFAQGATQLDGNDNDGDACEEFK